MFRIALPLVLLAAAPAPGQSDAAVKQLYDQGRAELAAGKLDAAQKSLEAALGLAERAFTLDHPNAALVIYELGEVFLKKEDYRKAAAAYSRSLTIREKHLGRDNTSTTNSVDRLGEALAALRDYARAEPLLLRALEARTRTLDPKHDLLNRSYQNLGNLYQEAGRPARAEPYYRKSLAFNEAKYGPDGIPTAVSLNALGSLQLRVGQYREAEANLARCLAIVEAKLGPKNLTVNIPLGNMAAVHAALGRYAEAEELYTRAVRVAEEAKGEQDTAVAIPLNNLAQFHSQLGRPAKAEELALRALGILESKLGKGDVLTAQCLASLGMIYLEAAEYTRSERAMTSALRVAEAKLGPDHPTVATMLNNLGLLYSHMQLYDKAEPAYLRSLAVREKVFGRDHSLTVAALMNLGDLYAHREEYGKAESFYDRARAILEAGDGGKSQQLATLLTNIYRMKIETENRVRLDLLERALAILVSQLGPKHPQTARVRFNLGYGYYRARDFAKAEPVLAESAAVLRTALGGAHPDAITAERALSLTRYELGRRDDALRGMDAARRHTRQYVTGVLPGLTPADRQTFLRGTDATVLSQALTMGRDNAGEEAFASASATWLANGKATLQEVEAQSVQAANAGDSPAAADLRAVRRELARLATGADDRQARRKQALADREKQLSDALRGAGGRLDRPLPWVELDDVRRSLPGNAVLIDIARFEVARLTQTAGEKWYGEPHYVAWVTPKTGRVRVVDLGPAEEIDRLVLAARAELTAAPKAITRDGEPAAEKLLRDRLAAVSKRVLHPLLDAIGPADTWLVSPDSTLWLLPWAALPLPDGTYAVEKHAIRTAVSGRDLVALSAGVAPTAPVIVADPDFDLDGKAAREEARNLLKDRYREPPPGSRAAHSRLGLGRAPRLPGTAAEAEAIAPRLEAWLGAKPQVYTERQALKSLVLSARNPAALVLSTHGFFKPDQEVVLRDPDPAAPPLAGVRTKGGKPFEDPLARCGLLFAACNSEGEAGDDGVLTGLDVAACDLRGTRLVVLSACDTGLGDVRTGEGVAGLRQAFQLAGADGVVATLWQVPDLQSAQLMTTFFDNLAGKRPGDRALCDAQRELIRKRRDRFGAAHPYYWAAYTFTGRTN